MTVGICIYYYHINIGLYSRAVFVGFPYRVQFVIISMNVMYVIKMVISLSRQSPLS